MGSGPGLEVAEVRPGSVAAEMEIEPGDRIVRINGVDVEDLVDFQFLSSDDYLEIEVINNQGELWRLELDKEPQEDFGVEFRSVSAQGTKRCRNKCMFCFVDQMPAGMRSSLYEKDDDYRLSLTQGSFITLTNLSDEDFQRIIRLHLSPLYVSVHATDPDVRRKLLQNPRAGEIMAQLKSLAEAGITVHTQVVLVPGINDGEILARTVQDLSSLWPKVQSVAVVPVGLTSFRQNLASLERFTPDSARRVILTGAGWQADCRSRFGVNFLYFSDEFYVEADLDFPVAAEYDDFPQLENGVGLTRLFIDEVEAVLPLAPKKIELRKVRVVTGVSAAKIMTRLLAAVCRAVQGLEASLDVAPNRFFGPSVTVAGLLTGSDLLAALPECGGAEVLIPRAMLKAGESVFLDDLSLAEVSQRLGAKLIAAEASGYDFLAKLLGQPLPETERGDNT